MKSSRVYGVDIQLNDAGDVLCNAMELFRKNNEVEIIAQHQGLTSYEVLFNNITRNHPVMLSVDGKGLIHKVVKTERQDDDMVDFDRLINQVFPNYNDNDFYVQQITDNPALIYLTIVRKEVIDSIVRLFKERGFFVLNVSLGPFVLNQFQSALSSYDGIHANNCSISLENGEISAVSRKADTGEATYNIYNQSITGNMLMAYAIGFNFFINDLPILATDDIALQKEEYLYKNAFTYGLYTAVFLVFILLLINFFCFEHYNKRLISAQGTYIQQTALANQLDSLEKEILIKDSFIRSNKFLETSKVSFYADKLAYHMPEAITIDELLFFPRERDHLNRDEMKFKSDLIKVSGTTSNTEDLNLWIKFVKQQNWVKSLNMTSLKQPEVSMNTYFEYEIWLN